MCVTLQTFKRRKIHFAHSMSRSNPSSETMRAPAQRNSARAPNFCVCECVCVVCAVDYCELFVRMRPLTHLGNAERLERTIEKATPPPVPTPWPLACSGVSIALERADERGSHQDAIRSSLGRNHARMRPARSQDSVTSII